MTIKYKAYKKCPKCFFDADYYTTVISSPHKGYYECPHCGWKEDAQNNFIKKLCDTQIDTPPEFAKVINDHFWDLV